MPSMFNSVSLDRRFRLDFVSLCIVKTTIRAVCRTLIQRQIGILESGKTLCQELCLFADHTTITRCRDNWARTISPNPNVKIYVGAPASSTAAGGGYQAIGTMSTIATTMRKSFPSFGGVMMWDASQAYGECCVVPIHTAFGISSPRLVSANGRYDLAVKNALTAAGGTGFTFPSCSAPTFSSGTAYTGGSQVSYGGYAPHVCA